MNNKKIIDLDHLEKITSELKKNGKTIGLCHGTFDLMHIGHIKHFYEAKSKCDVLLVTLTPDKFVSKGPGRPLFNETLRAEAIAALECVDIVALNRWSTAVELISKIKPNVYIKGKDYVDLKDDLSGNISLEKEAVEIHGGLVHFTSTEKFSSSSIITKTIAFTYLNPHVYSDTVFFLGNFSKNFILDQKILFGIGASVASFLFFFVIGYLSKYLSHYAQNEKIWKIINSFIIGFMSLLTIYVILDTIN